MSITMFLSLIAAGVVGTMLGRLFADRFIKPRREP